MTVSITVSIKLKPEINDAVGVALEKNIATLGYEEFKNLRVGKTITFNTPMSSPETFERVRNLCEELFVNSIIEDYDISVQEL